MERHEVSKKSKSRKSVLTVRTCVCGCGETVAGKQKYSSGACRQRASVKRNGRAETRKAQKAEDKRKEKQILKKRRADAITAYETALAKYKQDLKSDEYLQAQLDGQISYHDPLVTKRPTYLNKTVPFIPNRESDKAGRELPSLLQNEPVRARNEKQRKPYGVPNKRIAYGKAPVKPVKPFKSLGEYSDDPAVVNAAYEKRIAREKRRKPAKIPLTVPKIDSNVLRFLPTGGDSRPAIEQGPHDATKPVPVTITDIAPKRYDADGKLIVETKEEEIEIKKPPLNRDPETGEYSREAA